MKVLGVMSGSSLDGLDLCLVEFFEAATTKFRIIRTKNTEYPQEVRSKLLSIMNGSAMDLASGHTWFGKLIGTYCQGFLEGESIDLIASHGHTVFHQPEKGFTSQIGCGAQIAAMAGVPTVCDFRSGDIALSGQGAPLVPFGEKHLFPRYDGFLNLGGIANISVHLEDEVIGYDICPCAQALDLLAQEAGQQFDHSGKVASQGTLHTELFNTLNTLPFYEQVPPRTLGREWFDAQMKPLIIDTSLPLPDRMHTMVAHIAHQIAQHIRQQSIKELLVTGGGAHNIFLVEQIMLNCDTVIMVPEKQLIDFKEALVFAYLGLHRWLGKTNVLASVTGAKRDSVGGAVHLP